MHTVLVGGRPQTTGDAVLGCGDNMSALSWVNECVGAKDRRARLLIGLHGRMEITSSATSRNTFRELTICLPMATRGGQKTSCTKT